MNLKPQKQHQKENDNSMERIGRLVSRSIQTNLEIPCEHQLCVVVFQNWLLQQQKGRKLL